MKIFGVFEKLFAPVATEEETSNGPAEEIELAEGVTTDVDGRFVNADGIYCDNEGNLVDEDGNLLHEEEEEEEVEKPTQSPEEIAQAMEIFKALNNKETAPAMMAFLNAKLAQNGLAPVSKTDLKEISVEDILKEGFGEEYGFLNDKLGPALSKAINKAVEGMLGTQLAEMKTALQSQREEIAATKISNALDPIIEEMGAEEFDKIATDLSKTMATYPNTSNLPLKVYIKNMITLTKSNKEAPVRREKVQKNVREAKRSLTTGVHHSTVKVGSKTPTYRESIELAMQGKKVED